MKVSKSVFLENITKKFMEHNGKSFFKAVDNISFEINTGEFITLLGPSGCGKTTTLRMIAGFEVPTKGNIYLGEECINNLTPDKRDTAMVFQSYALFPHYNVYDNIAYGLKLKKLNSKGIREKVKNIVSLVGLKGLESRQPNQLSGGQQQRVALARALVMEPGVLLFDEPLSNLDAKLRVYMRTEIRNIQRRLGLTSIYVTHDQSEAMSLSDRIIVMNKGKIEQIGSPREIYQKPATEFVADFIGFANFIKGTVKGIGSNYADIQMLGTVLRIPIDESFNYSINSRVKVVVRPEAVKAGGEGVVDGIVTYSTFMGSVHEYKVKIKEEELHIEEFNPCGKKMYDVNDPVKVNFQEESLHIIKA